MNDFEFWARTHIFSLNGETGYRVTASASYVPLPRDGGLLLLTFNKYIFLIFSRNFFFLLCNTETLSKVFELYDIIVPSIYVPEPAVTNVSFLPIDLVIVSFKTQSPL